MKLIIDIDEDIRIAIGQMGLLRIPDEMQKKVDKAIQHGAPLPKGHGRLKDVDWIDDNCPDYRTEDGAWCYKWEDIDNAETIIEADRAESEVRE